MSFTTTPTLAAVYAALIAFIVDALGLSPQQVVLGIPNRVPMPKPGFVVVQGIHKHRLRTNVTDWDGATSVATIEQGQELTVQIDCYGNSSAEWADILTTLLRDPVGCAALAPAAQPLYCDEARMTPLVAGENQYEQRWSLDAHLQVNPNVTLSQQSAIALGITLINVEERFPA